MANPVKLIDILSQQSAQEHLQCESCDGSGEILVAHSETGTDQLECENCLGSGYNQLGLIVQGILKPPMEGYGPVELKTVLASHLAELEQQAATVEMSRQAQEVQTTKPYPLPIPTALTQTTEQSTGTAQSADTNGSASQNNLAKRRIS